MGGHGLEKYAFSDMPGEQVNVHTIGAMLRRTVDVARENGVSDADIMAYLPDLLGGGGACGLPTTIVTGQKLQDALQQQAVPWRPELGVCPTNLDRYLAWIMRSSCTYNTFGKVGSSPLLTNTASFPDPDFAFNVSPSEQSLGVPFPPEWSGEGAYSGIFRVKVSFEVRVTLSQFTAEEILAALFEALGFRVIQLGTQDPFTVAVDFGEAGDAQGSIFVPSAGGYFFPEGGSFVPWVFDPTIQSYDFAGVVPGEVGTDEYEITARIRSYWKEIV